MISSIKSNNRNNNRNNNNNNNNNKNKNKNNNNNISNISKKERNLLHRGLNEGYRCTRWVYSLVTKFSP